jgi:hypothetical protein
MGIFFNFVVLLFLLISMEQRKWEYSTISLYKRGKGAGGVFEQLAGGS